MKTVSIIVPCYNSEKYIARLILSIINQSYRYLEVIFVNDGSNDNTEKIIKSYEKYFYKKGIKYKYLKKKNGGQASALNYGLKVFEGDYLCWPDSDDFFLKDAIKERVDFLENNKQYSLVRNNSYVCSEEKIERPIGQLASEIINNNLENLFENYILEKNVWYAPISFLIKSEVFLKVYPNREIFVSEGSGSQNFQMLIPISFKNKWGYIDKKNAVYTIRKNSYSRQWDTKYKLLERYFYHEQILKNVIQNKNIDIDIKKLQETIHLKYLRKKMKLAIKYNDKQLLYSNFHQSKKMRGFNISDRIIFAKGFVPFYNKYRNLVDKLKQKIKQFKYRNYSLKEQLKAIKIF